MRPNDPLLDTIARSVHSFFPRCVRCGVAIERYEDADVRILAMRVVHRGVCPAKGNEVGEPAI